MWSKIKKPLAWTLTAAAISAAIWQFGEAAFYEITGKTNPPVELTGGNVALKRLGEDQANSPRVTAVTLHTDRNRINRVNARRKTQVTSDRRLAGIEKPFRPLLTIDACGPGNIYIKGDGPTGEITFHLPKGQYQAEVFPDYQTEPLFQETPKEELLAVTWQPLNRGKVKVWWDTVPWSGPQELFLSTKNLIDIAGMLPAKKEVFPPDPKAWLDLWGEKVKALGLLYESENPIGKGWQKIRSQKDMEADGRANCLDIAILTAEAARDAGLDAHIIANSGHAAAAIGLPGEELRDLPIFEGTNYLIQKERPADQEALKKWVKRRDTKKEQKREPLIPEEEKRPEGPEPPQEEFFWVDIQSWRNAYRQPPQ